MVRERTKPIVVVANKADIAPEDNIERLQEAAERVVPCSAESELALRNAAEGGVVDYDPGDEAFTITGDVSETQRSGLDRITVYPVQNETHWIDGQGNVLPDAFLLTSESTPKDLASAVHSDIAAGYLHAVDARAKRRISEDHELAEGDVIKIVSTAN